MWKGTHQHVHTDVGESDMSFTSILLAVEMDTPGTFILHNAGGGIGDTLHVHTAGCGNGYTCTSWLNM
jgi:hypothetical protein